MKFSKIHLRTAGMFTHFKRSPNINIYFLKRLPKMLFPLVQGFNNYMTLNACAFSFPLISIILRRYYRVNKKRTLKQFQLRKIHLRSCNQQVSF